MLLNSAKIKHKLSIRNLPNNIPDVVVQVGEATSVISDTTEHCEVGVVRGHCVVSIITGLSGSDTS